MSLKQSFHAKMLSKALLEAAKNDMQDLMLPHSHPSNDLVKVISRMQPELETSETYQLACAMSIIIRKTFGVSRVDLMTAKQFDEATILIGGIFSLAEVSKPKKQGA